MVKRVLVAVCCAVLLAGAVARAQDAPKTPPRGDYATMRVNRLAEAVNLTDEQKAKVTELYKKQTEEMQKLRADTALSQEDRRTKMTEITKSTNDAIRALLTDDQKPKFDEFLKAPRRQPPPGGAPNPAPQTEGAK